METIDLNKPAVSPMLGSLITGEELGLYYYKPTRYTWIDLGGVLFGAVIVGVSLKRYSEKENFTDALLALMGAYMVYAHAQRFLLEPTNDPAQATIAFPGPSSTNRT